MNPVTSEGKSKWSRGSRIIWKFPLVVMTALIVLVLIISKIERPLTDVWTSSTTGTLYETHTQTGRPSIEIFMYGFQDASFAAWVVDGQSRVNPFDHLVCTLGEIGANRELPPIPHATNRAVQGRGEPVYQVAWSADGKRFGLAVNGYFVAAYDLTTKKRLTILDAVREFKPNASMAEERSRRIADFIGSTINRTQKP